MSTLHKVKAYFGMVPMDDFDDEYVAARPAGRRSLDSEYDYDDYAEDADYGRGSYEHAEYDRGGYDRVDSERGYAKAEYDRPGVDETYGNRYDRPLEPLRRSDVRAEARPEPRGTAGGGYSTRGALAVDLDSFPDESALSALTTVKPASFEDARLIGERFRDGKPVVLDLTGLDSADARRLVDFAAGLAFGLRGTCDRIATKVFLISTTEIAITAEDRARIETSYHNR